MVILFSLYMCLIEWTCDNMLTYNVCSVEMASQIADLQLAMKQVTKEEELRQAQIENDTNSDQLQTKLQELQDK